MEVPIGRLIVSFTTCNVPIKTLAARGQPGLNSHQYYTIYPMRAQRKSDSLQNYQAAAR
ncbi:hypothetical protein [Levilinea saccharolytica]|uniref:hypothetical protein n=1 Tax=Levilinea saccharolytica TaxID=229921 RepID=UPI001364D787|nr:hypothetical protein [Levilinea saccharolytica]